ncbi:hypothetical protein [Marispirochaeta sp.]|uniref:hypothetical protein n=1 Tax=Marispirochaeta sp. TaxID=2038653 RepID=UPI0029C883AB|nr:hypothetical protein [Marispirochaeta sp.]
MERNNLFKFGMILILSLSIMNCVDKEADEHWKDVSNKAKTVKPFESMDSVIAKIGEQPTTRDDRKLTLSSENSDIITVLVWDYGSHRRIFMRFFNDLSAELKIGDSTIFFESLNEADMSPKFKKK